MTADLLLELALANEATPDLLLEARLDFLAQKHAGISTDHDLLAQHKTPEAIVGHFAQHADPTTNKQYTGHIMGWYAKKQIRQEDHGRIHQALSAFHANKHRLPVPQRDLGGKSLSDVEHLNQSLAPQAEKVPWASSSKDNETVANGSVKILNTTGVTIRRVKTHDAMKVLGSGTKWCVVPSEKYFDQYHDEGPLLHIHDKEHDKRFLFHSESEQFMDVEDHPISDRDTSHLFDKHPEVGNNIKGFMPYVAGKTSSTSLQRDMFHTNDPHTTHRLITNRRLHPDVAHEIVQKHVQKNADYSGESDDNYKLAHTAADWLSIRKDLHPETLKHFYDHFHPNDHIYNRRGLILHLGENPSTPPDVLHDIAYSSETHRRTMRTKEDEHHPQITRNVAYNPSTQARTLDLIHNASPGHDQVIAKHDNTSTHTLDGIVKRGKDGVYPGGSGVGILDSVARHPNVSAEAHHELLHNPFHQYSAAHNSTHMTRDKLLDLVKREDDTGRRVMLSAHPLADDEVHETVYAGLKSANRKRSNDSAVVVNLVRGMSYPKQSPDVLHDVATGGYNFGTGDHEYNAIRNVVNHPRVREGTLEHIANHYNDSYVRDMARDRLSAKATGSTAVDRAIGQMGTK